MATNPPYTPFDDYTPQDTPPLTGDLPQGGAAADVIRDKVARIYGDEPDARQELDEAEHLQRRSKHQKFMYDLSTSGRNLAQIQTEWHTYYQSLPPDEKHQVWQEFYASQSAMTGQTQAKADDPHRRSAHKQQAARPHRLRDARSAAEVQAALRHSITAGGQLEAKHHLQSLLFGLSMGLLVVLVFLFGFFNEVFIAPFVQPSRTTAATPLIVSNDSVAPSATPEIIIPKINVEIPVNYDQTSTEESVIENALETGIVHYPSTTRPGETGNAAFFGHSSNNIFNKGKYKFAFVLLHTLVPGDTFYLTYQGKVYVYKVITRDIVDPSNVGVLNPVAGQTATATLITCDPPGTSLRRLVVVGQQISPDPSGNAQTTAPQQVATATPKNLPGNGPTLWGRFISTVLGKAIVTVVLVTTFLIIMRIMNKRFASLLR